MKTLVLLAGRSRRFWPLSEKALWPFMGKPLLTHQLARMNEGGLTDITFVGGHHNLETIYSLMPNVPSIEQEDLEDGMRGALLSALPQLKADSVCIVSSNDVIEPEGYKMLFEASQKEGVDGAILAQRVKRHFPGGYLVTSPGEEGKEHPRVAGVVEKPEEGREPSDLVNIVAHVHNNPAKLLDILEDVSSDRDDAYEVALTKLCKELNYVAVPYEEKWNAVKYPWQILDVTERFLSNIKESNKAEVHPSAVIEGPVILEEGVKVLPHATVKGPCYIGKDTIIGNNCLIRDSIIGEKCVIGFGSEIVRSNLHSNIWTHSTYLGDSVIGHNVAFGAGSTAANFRLDEGEINSVVKEKKLGTQRAKLGVIVGDNVRCGVQTVFSPGVKVGQGSFINSAVSVTRDVKENKYVTVEEGVLEERENKANPPTARS
jgi:UDP-N-acetylglucosamine diphosphorylase / glucose-1-phosphate thymidylyltransferase / UDP-N-acetylgalactosamine diphosphorylase / glucosamine-1-phosphate N-acetyltransferase / galactosamine-1-phosphate N-acetyltransferase